MKVISRIVIVLSLVGLIASLPAGAACALSSTFSSGYISGTVGDNLQSEGSFWAIGQYDPASLTGHDNGNWQPNEGGDGWLRGSGDNLYLAGDWAGVQANPADGCPHIPPNVQPARMAFVVSLPGTTAGTTLYFAGCAEEDAGGNFGFAGVAAAPIPRVVVTSSVRSPGQVVVNLAAPVAGGGIADTASCSLGVGTFRVYQRTLGQNDPAPSDQRRTEGGWTQLGPDNPTSVTVPCVGDQAIYLAYGLQFSDALSANGPLLNHVGQATTVHCGSTAADAPKNFKIIKKPLRTKTQ